ncbi:MAG: transposase, partial [Thermodesulfobacteriota bacterium]
MTYRWIKGSKLTNKQIGSLIDYFALEVPAVKAARILRINRHTADRVYNFIRAALAAECEKQSPFRESDAPPGPRPTSERQDGTAGVASRINPVFGILMRNGRAHTRIVDDISCQTVKTIIRTRVVPEQAFRSESFSSLNAIVFDGNKHLRITHNEGPGGGEKNRSAGADNFWGFVKTKLKRYYGVSRPHFYLYLKEMEFRYNHRNDDLRMVI